MNKDEFEAKFKEGATAGLAWSQAHGKVSLAIACFAIGFVLGKFL